MYTRLVIPRCVLGPNFTWDNVDTPVLFGTTMRQRSLIEDAPEEVM